METIIFIIFCGLAMYIVSLAEKRYKCEPLLEELIDENIKLKQELEKKMGD